MLAPSAGAQFTCFTGTKVHILKHLRADFGVRSQWTVEGCVLTLMPGLYGSIKAVAVAQVRQNLYFCTSKASKPLRAHADAGAVWLNKGSGSCAGSQFTCFTGTKVQILTLLASRARRV
jgi:hypothetical protein